MYTVKNIPKIFQNFRDVFQTFYQKNCQIFQKSSRHSNKIFQTFHIYSRYSMYTKTLSGRPLLGLHLYTFLRPRLFTIPYCNFTAHVKENSLVQTTNIFHCVGTRFSGCRLVQGTAVRYPGVTQKRVFLLYNRVSHTRRRLPFTPRPVWRGGAWRGPPRGREPN